ncbi:hypothetical protein CWATWH0401_1895 [Crocosphaera watsonii WH 0401]|uniref:Uncharacterized protein n=1 Tax=Crocosphaera watsonii WH 0401 TaxID=555881 RepID=T2JA99_CROWT|nr:hypothetical protein CWATWH0401_1895 [Crocosphaera watsonii WH 0401]
MGQIINLPEGSEMACKVKQKKIVSSAYLI